MRTMSGDAMLKVLGKPSSINVRKVLWTCEEIGRPVELEPYGTGFKPTDTPEFKAMNPNAQVPVIVDDGLVLWESNTICRYLAAHAGREDLLPSAPGARARVEQWMDWQATDLNSAWRYAFMALVRQSPAHQDPAAIAASVAEWNRLMRIADAQIARTGAFIAGDAFTLADVVVGLSTHRWFMAPIERPPLRAVKDYYERLSERPGFRLHGRNGMP
jgi:glutathione S-transferase